MVIFDWFSKSLHLSPLPGLPTASEIAKLIFTHVFQCFGIPENIVSDRGMQFMSWVWASFMEKLGVTVRLTSVYSPTSQWTGGTGQPRDHKILRTFALRTRMTGLGSSPGLSVPKTPCHSATQLTPFQCVLRYQPPLFPWNANPIDSPAVDNFLGGASKWTYLATSG